MRTCACGHVISDHGSDRACFYCRCVNFNNGAASYGTCRVCGCSDSKACPAGCSWADYTHTLCSACKLVAA